MYVLDIAGIDLNSAILIQLDDDLKGKNDTLEIFLNLRNQHLQCVMFYYDLNFDSYEFDYNSFFDKSKDSKSYQSAHPYLYVYKISTKMCKIEDYGILLLRARNAHTKNCAFKDNVFDAFNAAKYNKIISFLANENGTCEIILLNLPTSYNNLPMDQQVIRGVLHVITHFWTTSIYENVKIYIGSLKKELMLEFNQTEKEPLNAMLLSSQYYTILLPKNSSLVLQCNEIPINPINLIYPYKGIWSSPFYGTFPSGAISRTILGKFYIPKNIVMTIKILEFNTSAALLFQGPNTTIYADGSSKIYSFTEYLTIIFGQNNNAFTGVLMEIETKKKDKNL